MNSFLDMVKSNIIAQAVLSIIIGLLLMFWPGITIITVLYLVGIMFAVMGISSLVSYFKSAEDARSKGVLATGVFFCVIALIAFLFPQVIASFFSVVLGIILVVCGVVNAVRSMELKRYGRNFWIAALVLSALIALGGIVIIANPFQTTALLVFVLGLIIVSNGIVDLIIEAQLRKAVKFAN
jgi:uncharacterized membrane protein HdeD (DUF308 family)